LKGLVEYPVDGLDLRVGSAEKDLLPAVHYLDGISLQHETDVLAVLAE
jgi:hypothetical protein